MIDRDMQYPTTPDTETPMIDMSVEPRLRGIVIEQDGRLRKALCRALAAIGMEVRGIADSAALAVVLPASAPVDLLICDIGAQRSPDAAVVSRWTYDASRWRLVAPNGNAAQLTLAEAQLLRCLIARQGEVASREELLLAMSRPQIEAYLRNLDVTVSRLRKKVDQLCKQRLPIVAVRGRGYAFNGTAVLID